MDKLVKINNIATSWMEGHYNGEDLPADLAKSAFAAMHDIYDLSKDGGWTPCSVALPLSGDEVDVSLAETEDWEACTAVGAYKYGEWIVPCMEERTVIAWKERAEPYRGEA